MKATLTNPLAVLTVGFENIILPSSVALKVMALLQGARSSDYHSADHEGLRYSLRAERLRLKVENVEPKQLLDTTLPPTGAGLPTPPKRNGGRK